MVSQTGDLTVQTQVALDAIGPVIYGYHENPFDILGPHEVEDSGRRALAVRAYLPEAQRAWVVDPAHGSSRPMRRIHPAGLYEAVCPPDTIARLEATSNLPGPSQ